MEDYRLEQTGQEVQQILNGAAMDANLQAEVERATDAEGTLQGNIDSEERARQDADGLLQQGISDEENRAKRAEEANAGDIADIKALIPSTATGENKLVDVNQMNSSIATATATYRGNYNLVTDLHLAIDATHAQIETLLGTVIAEADNNDYCYVMVPTSAETPTQIAKIERYKFNGTAWAFEYDVNNSGYTAAQWAAINSGITSGLVAKLNALPSNTDLLSLLAGKQDVLTFDNVPVEGSNNVVKSGGVHSAIDDEKTARVNNVNTLQGEIDGIEGKIPSGASSANKLVDTATMESAVSTATATFRGDYNLVSDLHLAIDATHAQIATMLASEISTADNNDYAYVEIPTNAETPAQIARVERYKFNGTEWGYEYTLNNSGFTANQWAAINSMITSGLVDKLTALPTNSDLLALLAQKQDVLTWDQTPTENSTHPVTSGGVYAADKALSDAIEAILLLIPSAATSLNKLVDTALMNSSISTATATFRGTYNLVSDLSLGIDATELQIAAALALAVSTADNNDYAFVQIPTSAETPAQIARTDRYKFNGTAWAFEYTLNTSGFTAAQWAAINSTITSALVTKLSALPTAAELQESLGVLTSGITAINQKIPSTAASDNKLVDASTMESYIAQVIGILDATFNVTSTDGHITLHITQVDGVITSVQVQSTDIASAADLALKASQADLTALASRVTTAEGNITSLTGRMGTAETNIANLQQLYNDLQQSKPVPVTALPSTGQQQDVIYRLAGTTSYSDYMWNGSSWVLMATYNNAIDPRPKKASQNLVTSGGVFDNIGALDVSELNATENPHTLAQYADLSAALAAIPSDYQKGGMSIKFVQSSDNKYVQYRLTLSTYTDEQFSDAGNWQGVDKVPKTLSVNLVESGGVADVTDAIIGSDDTNVDLSIYSATNRDIGYSTGLWQNNTSDYQHIVVPVKVGRSYAIVSNSGIALQYTLLKSYSTPVVGQSADFCNGWSVVQKSIGASDEFIVPSDCAFLYIRTKNQGNIAVVSLTLKGIEGEIPSIKEEISQMESDISNIDNNIETIQDDIKEILGQPAVNIDLSQYTSNPYLGKLDFTSPYGWSGTLVSNNKKHIIVPVLANTSYTLLAKETGTLSLRYAFLKSYAGTSTSPDYCEGFGKPYVVAKGTAENVITPSDCTCLYLQYQDSASSIADLAVTKDATNGRLDNLEDELDKIKSLWKGKKIAWFGTSIPAGSNFSIPIKANAIDAYITSYKVEKTSITAEDNLPCEYPVIAASLLGAQTIYNESVGSSRIVKNTTNPSLLIRCKALTNTVEEICSYIWGSYIIDIANQTFEENHNNTINITTFLTTAGTWLSFVNNVMICLSQSYQIKLTLRHLISDSTQRSSYVNDVFGTYYNDVVSMLASVGYTLADLVGYGEADLFVLEHSVNDNNPSMEYPVTSTDVTTFQGAYNKIIGEILRYKPSVRIVIVSNYGPDSTEIEFDKDKTVKLKEIAEHWQIAFCEMIKYINVSATSQLTQGYWEQNANVWHDSGFQWTEDAGNDSFTTNAYFHPDLYSSSLEVIKQNINPQLIHGVWYWEAPARYIWMRDAVHPHSDNAGRLCIILAKTLAKWIDMLGNV